MMFSYVTNKEIFFLPKWWVLGGFDWDEHAVAFGRVVDETAWRLPHKQVLEVLGGKEHI